MDAKVIPFPGGRGSSHPVCRQGAGASPQPKFSSALGAGERFAVLSLEVRAVPRLGPSLAAGVTEKVLQRCVRAAATTLARLGVAVQVAGTADHPVIEARFEGEGSPARAACGALAASDSVRQAQRAPERAFAVGGGLAAGRAQTSGRGVRVAWGAAPALAGRLRETSAPGQLLLAGVDWDECASELETIPASGLDGVQSPVRILRGIR